MELDSDTLYIIATAFSILSVVVVLVVKLCFGRNECDDGDQVDKTDHMIKGKFSRLPLDKWKQQKQELEREYKKSFAGPSKQSVQDSETVEKNSPVDPPVSDKATGSTGKMVHFQDVTDQKVPPADGSDDGELAMDEDEKMKDILNENLDEATLEHLPANLKTAKLRKATKELEKGLTDEQREEETRIRGEQLDAIFALMREQEEKFGVNSMEDIEEQLKLYSF